MMRVLCSAAALVALLGAGCSGGEGGAGTPTSPTPTTGGAPGPQTPTNSSCVPGAPNNLRVAVNGSSRVFNWDAVNGANDYFIQIGSGSGASDFVNTNTSQTTYTWTGQGPGTYYARVYARNTCGSGPNSTQITFN